MLRSQYPAPSWTSSRCFLCLLLLFRLTAHCKALFWCWVFSESTFLFSVLQKKKETIRKREHLETVFWEFSKLFGYRIDATVPAPAPPGFRVRDFSDYVTTLTSLPTGSGVPCRQQTTKQQTTEEQTTDKRNIIFQPNSFCLPLLCNGQQFFALCRQVSARLVCWHCCGHDLGICPFCL